ncbi:MAG: TIGR03087 family PEP-CTERM/XrtA system glycosyltransferase [Burkholderiales bacterium]|nr:TIGR03087 family PEP-CTERM/XrtA system glycosyltransferase [Burkholderiales bacterium]
MQDLLYLAHRIPYPPNKGDKVRSFNEVKHLAKRYRVHLGAFIDDADDWQHRDALTQYCGETYFASLSPARARLRSAKAFFTNEALTLPYYRDAGLAAWVKNILAYRPISHVVVYSSPMAQYVRDVRQLRRIADFVDVDSDKWSQYAASKSWPWSLIYRREAKKLAAFEQQIAAEFDATLLVAPHEADLLRAAAPAAAQRIHHVKNGVDAHFFSPEHTFVSPYSAAEQPIVFTGAMDYWPNVDAVEWFADEVFPKVKQQRPQASFYMVGARPAPSLQRLKGFPGVTITGSVPDVRPYIAHARLAVAPLRIARGVQNKVLEAMAMAKTVVVSPQAAAGIAAKAGEEYVLAADSEEFAAAITELLNADARHVIGKAARARVLADYSWSANLARLDSLLGYRAQPEAPPPMAEARPREVLG